MIHGPCRHVQCQSLTPASRVPRANRVRPQPVRSDDSDTSDIHGRGERPIDTRRCLHQPEAEFAGWHHCSQNMVSYVCLKLFYRFFQPCHDATASDVDIGFTGSELLCSFGNRSILHMSQPERLPCCR